MKIAIDYIDMYLSIGNSGRKTWPPAFIQSFYIRIGNRHHSKLNLQSMKVITFGDTLSD